MTGEENVCGGKEGTERALEAEGKNGSAVLGKFRDVNALAEAYGALEAEFTRRSQRLRELEKRAENPASGVAAGTAEKPDPRRQKKRGRKSLCPLPGARDPLCLRTCPNISGKNGRKRRAPAIRTKTSSMRRPGAAKECD